MANTSEDYTARIVNDENNSSLLRYILVEHTGKLTEELQKDILEYVSKEFFWVYEQFQIDTLKVRIRPISTLSRMHSIEEYDSKEFYLAQNNGEQ